jgi:parallel beta-helix repeat protein
VEQVNMKKTVALLVVWLFLCASCMAIVSANADADGIVVPDDYSSIQAAVDATSEGSVIFVRSGTYYENVAVNKSLSLVGENCEDTVIYGNWSEGYLRPISIMHDGVGVFGFALADAYSGVSILNVDNCRIEGNKFVNNRYGVTVGSGSGNCVVGNSFESTKFGAYAIQLTRASDTIIEGNDISDVSVGIAVTDTLLSPDEVVTSQNNTITQNTIVNCSDRAVWFKFTKQNRLVDNVLANCSIGLALMWTDNNEVYRNNFMDNTHQIAAGKEPIFSGGSDIRYSTCQWTDGGAGNFWSDYRGKDGNGDGVGDTAYVINEANRDELPLMNPLTVPATNPPATEWSFPADNQNPAASKEPAVQPDKNELPVVLAVAAAVLAVVALAVWAILRGRH